MQFYRIEDRPRPGGYSDAVAASGETIYLAGQVGWNREERFESDDFLAQACQALSNIRDLLQAAGARTSDIVRMTWFVADRDEYLAAREPLGRAYREIIGAHYPAMSVVEVSGFIEAGARLEIETTAVRQARTVDGD